MNGLNNQKTKIQKNKKIKLIDRIGSNCCLGATKHFSNISILKHTQKLHSMQSKYCIQWVYFKMIVLSSSSSSMYTSILMYMCIYVCVCVPIYIVRIELNMLIFDRIIIISMKQRKMSNFISFHFIGEQKKKKKIKINPWNTKCEFNLEMQIKSFYGLAFCKLIKDILSQVLRHCIKSTIFTTIENAWI